jgi:hypothetical protein
VARVRRKTPKGSSGHDQESVIGQVMCSHVSVFSHATGDPLLGHVIDHMSDQMTGHVYDHVTDDQVTGPVYDHVTDDQVTGLVSDQVTCVSDHRDNHMTDHVRG